MINTLRSLAPEALKDFTEQLKLRVVGAVKDKIPHLEASLAVAELSVALHVDFTLIGRGVVFEI